MPIQMFGRPITTKQTGYGFYRPAAVQIANVLADMPFSATRILIYDIIIYFMSHLDRSAGRFFIFHLISYITFLAMQGFFRTIGLFCSNFHTAFRVGVSIFPTLILYSGYMIPIDQMKRWLFWVVSQLDATTLSFADRMYLVLHKSSKLRMVSPHEKRVSDAQCTYFLSLSSLGSIFTHIDFFY
jgi:ABC-type multidrug transport system permease subunit